MNHTEKKYISQQELIQDFLHQTLGEEDRENFEAELSQYPALKEEVDFDVDIVTVLENKELLEASALVGSIVSENTIQPDFSGIEIESENKSKKWWSNNCILISSAVLVLLSGFIMWQISATDKHSYLVAVSNKHLSPMENVINIDKKSESPIHLGMVAYENEDYKTTVEKLQAAPKWKLSPSLRLYLGIALLYNNQLPDAIEQFQQVIVNDNKHYKKEAKWYLSLTYLQMEELEKAKALLKDIKADIELKERVEALLLELGLEGKTYPVNEGMFAFPAMFNRNKSLTDSNLLKTQLEETDRIASMDNQTGWDQVLAFAPFAIPQQDSIENGVDSKISDNVIFNTDEIISNPSQMDRSYATLHLATHSSTLERDGIKNKVDAEFIAKIAPLEEVASDTSNDRKLIIKNNVADGPAYIIFPLPPSPIKEIAFNETLEDNYQTVHLDSHSFQKPDTVENGVNSEIANNTLPKADSNVITLNHHFEVELGGEFEVERVTNDTSNNEELISKSNDNTNDTGISYIIFSPSVSMTSSPIKEMTLNDSSTDTEVVGNTSDSGKLILSGVIASGSSIISCCEANFNHIRIPSFAKQGNNKEVITFTDTPLRTQQIVTKINKDNQTIVGEAFYDHQGRAVIQPLPLPINSSILWFYSNFNQNTNTHIINLEKEADLTGINIKTGEKISFEIDTFDDKALYNLYLGNGNMITLKKKNNYYTYDTEGVYNIKLEISYAGEDKSEVIYDKQLHIVKADD